MIEEIKELNPDDTITIEDESVEEFTGQTTFTVSEVRIYSNDDCEIVLVGLDEFYLIIHSVENNPRYFMYELQESGTVEDLIEEGYNYINDDDDFRKKIVIREEGKTNIFKHSELGAIYDLNVDRDDEAEQEPYSVSICEYISNNAYMPNIFIERVDDDANIFTGFEIEEDVIEL